MAESTLLTVSLDGLEQAFEVQGGLQSPEQLRTEAGVYLQYDVQDHLSRNQSYWVQQSGSVDTSGGAASALSVAFPSGGLRFGRYLVGVSVVATASPALLTGGVVGVVQTGAQPDFPACPSTQEIVTFGPTNARPYGTSFMPIMDNWLLRLPLWMSPGSYIIMYINTSGASTVYNLKALWATTEALSSANLGTRTAVGGPRAAVKI